MVLFVFRRYNKGLTIYETLSAVVPLTIIRTNDELMRINAVGVS